MIGVFSYNVVKWGKQGGYNPCLTEHYDAEMVYGITTACIDKPSLYGVPTELGKAHLTICNAKFPPLHAPLIVTSHCKEKRPSDAGLWLCADTGGFFYPSPDKPVLWEAVSDDDIHHVLSGLLQIWDSDDIDSFLNEELSEKLKVIQGINGLSNPTLIAKKLVPKAQPYKWILKNGVVSFPEHVSPEPWPFPKGDTQKSIKDLLNSLTSTPTGTY